MNSFPSKKHLNTDFVEFRRKKLKKTYSVDSIKALKCIYPYLPWLLNAY